jgi:hypothetical protein
MNQQTSPAAAFAVGKAKAKEKGKERNQKEKVSSQQKPQTAGMNRTMDGMMTVGRVQVMNLVKSTGEKAAKVRKERAKERTRANPLGSAQKEKVWARTLTRKVRENPP